MAALTVTCFYEGEAARAQHTRQAALGPKRLTSVPSCSAWGPPTGLRAPIPSLLAPVGDARPPSIPCRPAGHRPVAAAKTTFSHLICDKRLSPDRVLFAKVPIPDTLIFARGPRRSRSRHAPKPAAVRAQA